MSRSISTKLVQSYLNFDGRCEEAVEFYRRVLGAEVDMLMRMKDSPEGQGCGGEGAGDGEKIMHASFRIGETTLMASDCHSGGKPEFKGFSLSLSMESEAEAKEYFNALSEDGVIEMPLEKTFWSPCFGVVMDKFGVSWMINVIPETPLI